MSSAQAEPVPAPCASGTDTNLPVSELSQGFADSMSSGGENKIAAGPDGSWNPFGNSSRHFASARAARPELWGRRPPPRRPASSPQAADLENGNSSSGAAASSALDSGSPGRLSEERKEPSQDSDFDSSAPGEGLSGAVNGGSEGSKNGNGGMEGRPQKQQEQQQQQIEGGEAGVADFRIPRSLLLEGRRWASSHPPVFRRLATNFYPPGGPVRKPPAQSLRDAWGCECREVCSELHGCQNMAVNVECRKGVCQARDCRNQRIQKRQYVKTKVFQTEGRGWGLRCTEDVSAGDLIIEYVGEVIDDPTCNERLALAKQRGIHDFYMFKVHSRMVLDAGPMGNNARFINHSCEPNCASQKWEVGSQERVGIFALRDIPAGSELTYNYNFMGYWEPGEALQCLCGSARCTGFLGARPKQLKPAGASASKKKAQNKRKPAGEAEDNQDEVKQGSAKKPRND